MFTIAFLSALMLAAPVPDEMPSMPFGVSVYAPAARVEVALSKLGTVNTGAASEGMAPTRYVTNVEWNGVPFDTLIVHFNAASKATALTLVRTCDDDRVKTVAGEVIDVASLSYGEPTFADEAMARWERNNEALLSIGPYADNEAVWLRFELVPLAQRRSGTAALWPLGIPSTADKDEARDVMTDSCRKVIEDGSALQSASCSCYGVKARKTNVSFDGTGRISTIEMIISRADLATAVQRITSVFGAPNGPDPQAPSWMVEESVGISVIDADEGVSITFDILAIEVMLSVQR